MDDAPSTPKASRRDPEEPLTVERPAAEHSEEPADDFDATQATQEFPAACDYHHDDEAFMSSPDVTPSAKKARHRGPHSPSGEPKDLRCACHGNIQLDPLLVEVANTSYFQRLRECKQLGTAFKVYPSANHTRFDHSLGVAHLAKKLCEKLMDQRDWPTGIERPSPRDCLCVSLAALVHDLGHGPFSHTFDGMVVPAAAARYAERPGADAETLRLLKSHKHELLSARMFRRLLEAHQIDLSNYCADGDSEMLRHEEDVRFVEELVLGKKLPGGLAQRRGRGRPLGHGVHSKDYLYDIVSNEDSGLDVDKLDYLLRDRKAAIGNDPDLCLETLFSSAAVRMAQFGAVRRPVIAYRDKAISEAFHVFRLRFDLHHCVYSHKVVEGYALLVTELLLALDALGPIVRVGRARYHLGESVSAPDAFLEMRDSVIERYKVAYLEEGAPGAAGVDEAALARARELLRRWENREHYKLIFERGLGRTEDKSGSGQRRGDDEIKAAVHARLRRMGVGPDSVEVQLQKLSYGKGDKCPLEDMRFFRKGDGVDDDARAFDRAELSARVNLPEKHEMRSVRIFYKARRRTDKERAEMKRVHAQLEKELGQPLW